MEKVETGKILRSRRRTIALVITGDARLEVRAPLDAPAEAIESFVAKKSRWISRKIAEVAARPKPRIKIFEEGEEFLYLGRLYPLSIVGTIDIPLLFDDHFYLALSRKTDARELFSGWYRDRAVAVIKERLDLCASLNGIRYDKFNISNACSKWGSCAGGGDLRFSWRLVMAPLSVIDYVVAHELAHIYRKDHSKRFWESVEKLFPLYRESVRWLKDNGHLLAAVL